MVNILPIWKMKSLTIVDKKEIQQETPDFKRMLNQILVVSLGFLFTDYFIIYFSNQVLNATGLQLGLYYSIYTAASFLTSFLIGYLSDKYSKKNLIRIGSFLRGIAYIGIYLSIISFSIMGIYLSSIVLGAAVGIFWIPFDSLIAEKTSKYHRSSAYAKKTFRTDLGSIIGVFIGLFIYIIFTEFQDYNHLLAYSPIIIYALGNFIAFLRFATIIDESLTISEKEERKEKISNKRTNQLKPTKYKFGLMLFFSVLFIIALIRATASIFMMPYILNNIENSAVLSIWVYLSPAIFCMIFAPKLGHLGDSVNNYLGISLACIFGGVVTFMMIFCRSIWIFILLGVFDSLIIYFYYFIIRNYLSRISITHRGKVFGLYSTINNIGYIIGAIFGGLLFDFIAETAPFIVSAFVEWSLIPIFLIAIKLTKSNVKETIN
ncbi:MAG: putative Major Facilitator Superfamily protein [Promethearchaeota archaeon]|nr:MAG: putative Major Facilitator Superfamily protein [Candidatus Lokiarchaeota archaeon]